MPVSLFCINCNSHLGDTSVYQFYERFAKWYQIMVKINKRNLFLEKFGFLEDKSEIVCLKCKFKIGQEKSLGPKKEMCLCIAKESIFFIKSTTDYKQKKFGKDLGWKELIDEYAEFILRKKFNFYKGENNDEGNAMTKEENNSLTGISKGLSLYQKYKYSCKYTIQSYLCDEYSNNDGLTVIKFLEKIHKLDGFVKVEPAKNNTYLSNEIEDCVVHDLEFEMHYNREMVEAEQEFAFESIKTLLEREKNQAFIWLQKEKKVLIPESSENVHAMCNNIEFGNLNSPFKFFKSLNAYESNAKLSVLYDQRLMYILLYHESVLHKFEVDFNILESFFCINEDRLFFEVFIPCKRPLSIYRAPKVVGNFGDEFKNAMLKTLDEESIDWEKISFKNCDWTIKLQFNLCEKSQVFKALEKISFNRILFSKVSNVSSIYTINDLRSAFQSKDFETRYYLECLISQYYSILHGKINKKFAELLLDSNMGEIRYIIKNLCLKLRSNRFISLDKLVETILREMNRYGELELGQMNQLKNYKILNIKHAIITPSRVIYYFPEPNVSNRVLRQFDYQNFLCVRIRGENFQKLNMGQNYADMKEVYQDICKVLCAGIPFYDRKFMFLAMSSSQMRDHGCWLYAQNGYNITADTIRNWMGNFRDIRCVGKYAARLGQSLSCSIETIQTNNFKTADDVKRGGYCFTDGIGQISKAKAEEICKKYFNSNYISVFQIRFAGFKGVVSINPKINDELIFRPSMKKFESSNNRLDVLNKAEFIPCHLNRQVIIILSALRIDDWVFSKFQDEMLQNLSKILIDNNIAKNYLAKFFKNHYAFGMANMQINYSFEYINEPFFRELLKLVYNSQLTGLIHKSRIFIEKGRILMGVIDEYGLLRENEVFIQCSTETMLTNNFKFYDEIIQSEKKGFFIVKAKVAVAKNPAMHPGDIRVLNAVHIKELEHLTNCIVFPQTGYRPITNMCSGSDLDGDLYFVTWEPLLIPKEVEEPMDYPSSDAKNKDSDVVIEDVIKFFTSFIEIDQLGRLSNAHVAISDSSPIGVHDSRCKKLATAFSKAVDFPKTGEPAEMPQEARKIEKYPDFMEKHYNDSYESQKIIGKMYRKCKKIASHINYEDKIEMNPCFVLEGHHRYLEEANKYYEKYRYEIDHLMNQFECNTESELLIGVFFHSNKQNDSKSKNDFKLSTHMVKNVWIHFRELFFEEFDLNHEEYSNLPKTVFLKASAWYVACYNHHANSRKTRIISFPWIIEDILCRFKVKNYSILSKSILEKYCESSDLLIESYYEKFDLKQYLEKSVHLTLFMPSSIDMFMYKEINSAEFESILPNTVCNYRELKQILEKDDFHNIRFSFNDLICEHDYETRFRISSSKYNLARYLYIRESIFSNPFLLPIFHVIVHFARLDKVLARLSGQSINLNIFLVFLIKYFKNKKVIKIDENTKYTERVLRNVNEFDQYDDWSRIFESISPKLMDKMDVDSYLLNFYYDLSFESKYVFSCPFELIEVSLNQEANENLKTHFSNCLNFISKVNDISLIWNIIFSENREEKKYYRRRRPNLRRNRRRGFSSIEDNLFSQFNFLTHMQPTELDEFDFKMANFFKL